MPKIIIFTKIQRLEILDCLPKTRAQEAYLDDLEYHARPSSIWEKMRVGKKKSFAQDTYGKIEALEKAVVYLEQSLSALADAHREDEYAPFPVEEALAETDIIRHSIQRLSFLHTINTPYTMADGRDKGAEKDLCKIALGLWCRHFPDHPLPKDPRQGRLSGGHEDSPALRLCGIVIDAATGQSQKDLRRIYAAVMDEWESAGVTLIPPRRWCEMMDARVRDRFRSESSPNTAP